LTARTWTILKRIIFYTTETSNKTIQHITERIMNFHANVTLIGTGIMSATLGILLKELNPNLSIQIIERLPEMALESSDAMNNAGTGHSAYCELNYSELKENGDIDISKAIKIASSFQLSRELWAYLVKNKKIIDSQNFTTTLPHISFVWGDENSDFLRKRFEKMSNHPLFEGIEFSDSFETIKTWIPLVIEGRGKGEKIAATRINYGSDVNFGALTKAMFAYLKQFSNVHFHLNSDVRKLHKTEHNHWDVKGQNLVTGEPFHVLSDFVFIGAGGGSLHLLQETNIEEANGYGGFPISGKWLVCNNPKIIQLHNSKVYGKASVGSPPMSVPHLDTRIINGEKKLLFGPFAGFSTKFLKHGSYWDLMESIELKNIFPMLSAGWHNIPLTKYLIHQVSLSHVERMEMLREYYPLAKNEDWDLITAGQRVQVIKKDDENGGVLEFGTEVVCSKDNSIAALLGASPGASTAVKVMLDILTQCFPKEINSEAWKNKLSVILPSYGKDLAKNSELIRENRAMVKQILG
jgi:malate dehydrogenase (quinone)